MEGIQEPVARPLLALLRRAVADHAAAERRRVHPPVLHVGWPGGPQDVFAETSEDRLDHALRADVAAALLRGARRRAPVADAMPLLWLTRPGPLQPVDVDLTWLAAARTSAAEAGVVLTFVAVNRHGWFDPRSDVRREWRRIRQRGS